jgi:hypothetical protein
MSFATIAQCTNDQALAPRVMGGYAAEGVATPEQAWILNRWLIAADPSINAAYASAIAGGNENPGGDEAVITDQMITAAVQAFPAPTEPAT